MRIGSETELSAQVNTGSEIIFPDLLFDISVNRYHTIHDFYEIRYLTAVIFSKIIYIIHILWKSFVKKMYFVTVPMLSLFVIFFTLSFLYLFICNYFICNFLT
jgi:hypothetical protein